MINTHQTDLHPWHLPTIYRYRPTPPCTFTAVQPVTNPVCSPQPTVQPRRSSYMDLDYRLLSTEPLHRDSQCSRTRVSLDYKECTTYLHRIKFQSWDTATSSHTNLYERGRPGQRSNPNPALPTSDLQCLHWINIGGYSGSGPGRIISDVTSYFILHQPRHSFNLVARVTRGSASDSLCEYIERSSRVPSSILY